MVFQPNLSQIIYRNNSNKIKRSFLDSFVWGKLIRTNIMVDSYNKIEKYYKKIWMNNEYIAESYILYKLAKSYRFIPKFGIYHEKGKTYKFEDQLLTPQQKRENELASIILIHSFFLETTDNTTYDKELAAEIMKEPKKISIPEFPYMSSPPNLLKDFITVVKKYIDNKYITENYKTIIKKNLQIFYHPLLITLKTTNII